VANKISVIIDATADKAVKSLKDFRTSIADADGAAGKLKAGFAGAMGAVKANAGTAALAAGTALVAFGVKAAGAFTDVALAADDAAKSTGLTVDQASRFIAVGDDYGITAEDIAKGLGKVTTTLDAAKWEKYGIATRDAAGNARDANAIILDTFDALSKETNATERANMAKELLGKGYQTLSPLIGKTREELEGYLGAVSDSQVITAKEAEKARKLSLAQDALSDAYLDVQLAVGSLVAELSPLIQNSAEMASKAAELVEKLGPLPEIMLALVAPVTQVSRVMGLFVDKTDLSKISLEDWQAQLESNGYTTEQIAQLTEDWIRVNKDSTEATEAAAAAAKDAASKIRTFSDAANTAAMETRDAAKWTERLAKLLGELDDEAATLSLEQQFIDLRTAAEEAYIATATGAEDAAEKQRFYLGELVRTKEETLLYAEQVANLPAEQVTQIAARLDEGNIAAVESALYWLTRGRTVRINGQLVGADLRNAIEGRGATGGIVNRPTVALIGEAGPEAVIPLNKTPGNSPLPGGMGGGTTVINITTGADPQAVVAAIKKYERSNGTNWRS
jgi:hypothetical protein